MLLQICKKINIVPNTEICFFPCILFVFSVLPCGVISHDTCHHYMYIVNEKYGAGNVNSWQPVEYLRGGALCEAPLWPDRRDFCNYFRIIFSAV